MKTVEVSEQSKDIQALLEQARQDDLIVRSPDGSEFMLVAIDEFDREIAQTRRNDRLMELLQARAEQHESIPLDEVRRQLGLNE